MARKVHTHRRPPRDIMRYTKTDIKNIFIRKPFGKRLALMLTGVIVMGICVAFLKMCHLGTDPFAAVNYGLSNLTGIDFGTLELIFNGVLLIFVLLNDISRLGFGTLGNMIVVGYTADFTNYLMDRFFGITEFSYLPVRIGVMFLALIVFVFAVALYINAGLGSSAYDALPFIIHEKLQNVTGKQFKQKWVRIGFDAVFTILGFVFKGEAGIITILMVLSLGPVIDYVSGLLSRKLNL